MMKNLVITAFIAVTITSVQATLPLTEKGCQCQAECKYCLNFDSLLNCGFSNQHVYYCAVNKETCSDNSYNKNGKVGDRCGSMTDWAKDLYQKMKSWFHKSAGKIKHLNAKVTEWATEYVHSIDVDDLAATDPALLSKVASVWEKFDESQLSKLKALSSESWDKVVAQIPPEDLAALSKTVQENLGEAKKLVARMEALKLEDVAKWGKSQWDRVPVDNMASMGWSALQKVPIDKLGAWTKEQWVKIPVDKLVRFTGEQIAKIDAESVAALSDKYWDKVPVYQIVHFGVELLQSGGVLEKMNATHIASVTAAQWKKVPVESIVEFSTEKLQAIDYVALGAWTKEQWDKVPIDTMAALAYQQIQAIPADKVGTWTQDMWLKFPTDQAIMFTGEQLVAGAEALKGMTKQQLAKYDWSQISEDAFAKLPTELQETITELRKKATDFDPAAFKAKVASLAAAKKTKREKLSDLQVVTDNPKATPEDKEKAVTAYNEAVVVENKLQQEVVKAQKEQMYEVAPAPASTDPAAANGIVMHVTASATMLLAALLTL